MRFLLVHVHLLDVTTAVTIMKMETTKILVRINKDMLVGKDLVSVLSSTSLIYFYIFL